MKVRHALLFVALPGGSLVALTIWLHSRRIRSMLIDLAKTGDPVLDSYAPAIVDAAAAEFGTARLRKDGSIVRALMSILNNELPAARPAFADAAGIVGDVSLGGGPSVGPLQVYRSTAKELGLYKPTALVAGDDQAERDEYAQRAQDVARCIRDGVAVFHEKLRAASGDVEDAVRRYNGGGQQAAAYRDRALLFAANTWGGLAAADGSAA